MGDLARGDLTAVHSLVYGMFKVHTHLDKKYLLSSWSLAKLSHLDDKGQVELLLLSSGAV